MEKLMRSDFVSKNCEKIGSLRKIPILLRDRLILSKRTWMMHVLLPIVFIMIMILFHPFRETFQIDPDEGINLIKAVLVMKGHQITRDIDTDQPPLLSNILAIVFQWTGQDVNVGRFVILIFSALLLCAAGIASQIAWDRSTSILVYLMLFLLPQYLILSVSVMIGQPSIALAMVALLCLFLWHRDRKWPWLALTGLFMSLSLFTKLFTVILLPVFGIGLLVNEWVILNGGFKVLQQVSLKRLLRPAFVFSVSLIGFSAILAITMLDLKNIMTLVIPHLEYWHLASATGSITYDLKSRVPVILLAAFGLGYSVARRKWLALYPAAWAIIAYLSLLGYNPIWWHHQMLITIPASMLAAFGVKSVIRGFWKQDKTTSLWNKTLVLSGLLIVGFLLNQHIPIVADQLGNRKPSIRSYGLDPASGDMLILNRMQSLAKEGDLIVTDMPIFAVRAKMLVPVELVWVSDKRFGAGMLSEQDFIDAIDQEKPVLVLIARYPLRDVRAYLEKNPNYEEVFRTQVDPQRKAILYHRIAP
jgi:hypothetical protein